MKMTKQEVKQEARQQDIAPEIKSAIRRRGMQMSRQRMLAQSPDRRRRSSRTRRTSPSRCATAATCPRRSVVAKGADLIALRIREIADEHDVAIVENPPLARALYAPSRSARRSRPSSSPRVAEVLAYVYRTSAPQAVVGLI